MDKNTAAVQYRIHKQTQKSTLTQRTLISHKITEFAQSVPANFIQILPEFRVHCL